MGVRSVSLGKQAGRLLFVAGVALLAAACGKGKAAASGPTQGPT
jgi:hypothetical protein